MGARLTLLWMAALAGAGAASANPDGPQVMHGTAGVVTAGKVLTVTNSPGTIINWRSFSVAPDETTRFIQSSAGSSVLNRVIPGGVFAPLGRIESNGQVMFLNGSVVSGAVNADLAALASTSLRLQGAWGIRALLRPLANPPIQDTLRNEAAATLFGERMFVLAAERQLLLDECGELLVAPGRSVEIADLRWPGLRVQLTAPRNRALNLNKLIGTEDRMFAAVVANSAVTSQMSEHSGTELASAAPIPAHATAPFFRDPPLSSIFVRASLIETALPPAPGEAPVTASSGQVAAEEMPGPQMSESAQMLAKDAATNQAARISLGEALKLAAADRAAQPEVEAPGVVVVAKADASEPTAVEVLPDSKEEDRPPIQVSSADTPLLPVTDAPAAAAAEVQPPLQVALAETPLPPVAEAPAERLAESADEAPVSGVAEMYADLPLTVREIWAAPKLARVEKPMPRIMIDHSGAIFHL